MYIHLLQENASHQYKLVLRVSSLYFHSSKQHSHLQAFIYRQRQSQISSNAFTFWTDLQTTASFQPLKGCAKHQRQRTCCRFYSSFSMSSSRIKPQLWQLNSAQQAAKIGQKDQGGGSRNHAGMRVLLWQLDLFLFTVRLVRCLFKELPVVGGAQHKGEVFAVCAE